MFFSDFCFNCQIMSLPTILLILIWILLLHVNASESRSIPIWITYPQRSLIFSESNGTMHDLYEAVAATRVVKGHNPKDFAIVFAGIIRIRDNRAITEIGISEEANEIQLIPKLDFVSLLEMVQDIENKESIPWFKRAVQCLSDSSAKHCRDVCQLGKGLHCDDCGILDGIDLSHLNLMGVIHLESLPQSIRALDIGFNDLSSINLDGLRGKSVNVLNVESNNRIQIETHVFERESGNKLALRRLELSSNQIAKKIADLEQWMKRQRTLNILIVDNIPIHRGRDIPHSEGMVNVVKAVTNKQHIPWYKYYQNKQHIPYDGWIRFGIRRHHHHPRASRTHRGRRGHYEFDLSGLGLEGHIDLGFLPRNVFKVDLSKNNLSGISFVGDGQYYLRELNIANNPNLKIDLTKIDKSSSSCCLHRALRFYVSSDQLITGQGDYVD